MKTRAQIALIPRAKVIRMAFQITDNLSALYANFLGGRNKIKENLKAMVLTTSSFGAHSQNILFKEGGCVSGNILISSTPTPCCKNKTLYLLIMKKTNLPIRRCNLLSVPTRTREIREAGSLIKQRVWRLATWRWDEWKVMGLLRLSIRMTEAVFRIYSMWLMWA